MALSQSSLACFSSFAHTATRRNPLHSSSVRVVRATAEPEKADLAAESAAAKPAPTAAPRPKKPVYSMKKGQIVRVDKEKYLNSINYLSVGHPTYYKGLDYIYEDRGEILDLRIFETGEYALIAWVGVPTAPAWLPTDMLIESERLNYERL
uniref:NADH dehydrogenase-like complex O n=1 Tax=Geranium maderense TaxID=28964 RepID=A0A0F7CYV9_9ROSI